MTNKQITRILIIAGSLEMGGLENQLVYFGKYVDKTRFQVDYTSTSKDAYYKNDIISAGCGFYLLPDPRKEGTAVYCSELLKLLKNNKYDVVHSHELFHSGIEMALSYIAGIRKRVVHSHSTKDGSRYKKWIRPLYHSVMRFMIRAFATDYLACSSEAGIFLFGKGIVRNKKFKVVPNSVETGKFMDCKEMCRDIPRKKGWKYIAHVGRFSEEKNQKFLIEVAKQFKEKNMNMAFVFVGSGPLFQYFDSAVKNNALEEYVIMLGARKDIPSILSTVDAFILPSLFEGMPLSLIEAQAAGLHCIIPDHITEEVDFGIGLLHRLSLNEPVQEWVAMIEKAVTLPRPDQLIIRNAIRNKRFDTSSFVETLCDVYGESKSETKVIIGK